MSRDRWRVGAGAAVVLVIGAVAGGAIVTAVGDAGPGPAEIVVEAGASDAHEVVVDVQGEVERPGVVVLAPGSRVLDAVAAAGGFTEAAEESAVNLAREVVDGEQLIVPAVGAGERDAGGVSGDGRISINRASAEELQQLPRVGPALSAAIISHREQHGPFTDIEQLHDVSGIGPAVLDQLRELVTL